MISILDLRKSLAGRPVLRGVDLEVRSGEILALVGESGTGKSILLKHVVGLMTPDTGEIRVGAAVLRRGSTYQELAVFRRRIGYVFQDGALLDSLTVRDNLRLALDDDVCRREPGYADHRLAESLATVNLDPSVLDRRPGELSGGMRKRVGVARGIIGGPEVILYDEPTTGLDPRNVEHIDQAILSARRRLGTTSLIVTHDLASVARVADRVALLADGRIRFTGSPEHFLRADEAAVREYLGRGSTRFHEVA